MGTMGGHLLEVGVVKRRFKPSTPQNHTSHAFPVSRTEFASSSSGRGKWYRRPVFVERCCRRIQVCTGYHRLCR